MHILSRKYPFKQSSHWLRDSIVFGAVVWGILFLLQPFGLSSYAGNKCLVAASFALVVTAVNIHAQQSSMQTLIVQTLKRLQQPTPEAYLNCIAELKRIDAMFPDSIQPKYQMTLQSLNFAVMYPHAPQTESLLTESGQTITQMEQMKEADPSELCTLRGFFFMARIVQDPAQNGPLYFVDVMQNYEKALKLNPNNQLAQQLQQMFAEGMKQQTGQ